MSADKHMVKAVTFDLWDTLFFGRDGDSNRRNAARCSSVAEAFNNLGVPVSAEQASLALKQVTESLLRVWDRSDDVSHIEQLELVVRFVSNGSLTLKNEWVEELSSAYASPFFKIPPYLNPEAENVLKDLTKAGKHIGLICNTGVTPGFALRKFLESEGVLEHFDFLAFSDEIGFRKPNTRIFHLVARKLKVDPCDIAHVGDNLRIDVWGAKNAGLKAIHFASEEGRDKIAEADPTSLVAISRNFGNLTEDQVIPNGTINSLAKAIQIIEKLEN